MSDRDERLYRPCVGIMLVNKERKIFVGRRLGFARNAWQMPQGGIDANEDPEDAAVRELLEETGVRTVKIIRRISDPLYYEVPDDVRGNLWGNKYIGQKQYWFLMLFHGCDDEIEIRGINPEFSDWRWTELSEVAREVVYFKRNVYECVVREFALIIDELLPINNG